LILIIQTNVPKTVAICHNNTTKNRKTMKLTNTATKIKPGMTLIEITVVILVLLTLISVLFIGANIYKRGADRAACILNIRNIHQAVRANQNLKGINTGAALAIDDEIYSVAQVTEVQDAGGTVTTAAVVAVERYLTKPGCPTDSGLYTPEATYPTVGTTAVVCANNGIGGSTITDHIPGNTSGW
jgi:type II secretory pathway pseudopilin PulG